jgi:pterin-4a-carbinolamine dehydratase
MSGSALLQRVPVLADNHAHHPHLHLVSHNNVAARFLTCALGGLSHCDLIMALKAHSFLQDLRP